MPKVVEQLKPLGWDLTNDNTWTETVFVSTVLNWYGNRIALFLTASAVDFQLASKIVKTPCFSKFRKDFDIDVHAVILINPVIFLIPEDLDVLYCGFDFDTGYGVIDYSHYDADDNLDEEYLIDWGWLQTEDRDEQEWSHMQIIQAFPRN